MNSSFTTDDKSKD